MHGGNLMIPNDPNDDRIIVLDAGLTTALEADWAGPFGYLLHALSTNDAGKVADKLVMFNINEKSSASLNKDAVSYAVSWDHYLCCEPLSGLVRAVL
jgi:predicted unusual protein kinase regulating ubiquinone biosynthesis (AarF/ABC1/UbiB family)